VTVVLVATGEGAARATGVRLLVERVSALPGVVAAGGATALPPETAQRGTRYELDGVTGSDGPRPSAYFVAATPGYFRALEARIVRGRDFERPFDQTPFLWTYLFVRSAADPARLARTVSQAITAADPDLTPARIRPMSMLVAEAVAGRRANAMLTTAFAILALALAAIGIGGLVSCAVSRRTAEMAVRLALGASSARVLVLVMRQALAPVGAGGRGGPGGVARRHPRHREPALRRHPRRRRDVRPRHRPPRPGHRGRRLAAGSPRPRHPAGRSAARQLTPSVFFCEICDICGQ